MSNCIEGMFATAWSALGPHIGYAVLGGIALACFWTCRVVARRLAEPPVMTAGKRRALSVLADADRALSAREIAWASRGELTAFALARQLPQLQGFGLVRAWEVHGRVGHPCFYIAWKVTGAGRALLTDYAFLDRHGVIHRTKDVMHSMEFGDA